MSATPWRPGSAPPTAPSWTRPWAPSTGGGCSDSSTRRAHRRTCSSPPRPSRRTPAGSRRWRACPARALGWEAAAARVLHDAGLVHDVGRIGHGDDERVSWVRHHHERHDGPRLPDGLVGDDIPAGARTPGLAAALDVMTGPRPCSSPLPAADALADCRAQAGGPFAPAVVGAIERLAAGGLLRAHPRRPRGPPGRAGSGPGGATLASCGRAPTPPDRAPRWRPRGGCGAGTPWARCCSRPCSASPGRWCCGRRWSCTSRCRWPSPATSRAPAAPASRPRTPRASRRGSSGCCPSTPGLRSRPRRRRGPPARGRCACACRRRRRPPALGGRPCAW
ncbi:HD-GYP domain-containing protein [Miltoncostaea marina]|uniref:HD-GYP domain-containing protein n=1 Tax=Miltoncostaea marina TaxID=2843215 RepID=UPI003CCE8208